MRFAAAVIVPWLIWGALDSGIFVALRSVSPDSFPSDVAPPPGAALLLLVLRGAYDFIAGWSAGKIAQGRDRAVHVAVALLLVTGVVVQIGAWDLFPVWYHLIFLVSIVPLALWGARLAGAAK